MSLIPPVAGPSCQAGRHDGRQSRSAGSIIENTGHARRFVWPEAAPGRDRGMMPGTGKIAKRMQ